MWEAEVAQGSGSRHFLYSSTSKNMGFLLENPGKKPHLISITIYSAIKILLAFHFKKNHKNVL